MKLKDIDRAARLKQEISDLALDAAHLRAHPTLDIVINLTSRRIVSQWNDESRAGIRSRVFWDFLKALLIDRLETEINERNHELATMGIADDD